MTNLEGKTIIGLIIPPVESNSAKDGTRIRAYNAVEILLMNYGFVPICDKLGYPISKIIHQEEEFNLLLRRYIARNSESQKRPVAYFNFVPVGVDLNEGFVPNFPLDSLMFTRKFSSGLVDATIKFLNTPPRIIQEVYNRLKKEDYKEIFEQIRVQETKK